MGLLTDEEIAHAWLSITDPIGLGGKFADNAHIRGFVQTAEAAILKKLAGVAGEPVAYLMQPNELAHRNLEKSVNFHKAHLRPDWEIHDLYTLPGAAALKQQAEQKDAEIERLADKCYNFDGLVIQRNDARAERDALQQRVKELERDAARLREAADAVLTNWDHGLLAGAFGRVAKGSQMCEAYDELRKAARAQEAT